jgi:hypothetical protein
MNSYDDIIDLPHHQSAKHPHMSMADRAAQFSSFAALTGHDAAIRETARLTDQKIELDEDEKAALDEKIRALIDRIGQHPEVGVTYFQPDEKKDGGAYVTVTGTLQKVDEFHRRLTLSDGTEINLDSIVDIRSATLDIADV